MPATHTTASTYCLRTDMFRLIYIVLIDSLTKIMDYKSHPLGRQRITLSHGA